MVVVFFPTPLIGWPYEEHLNLPRPFIDCMMVRSNVHFESCFKFFHLLNDSTVFKFAIGKHGCPGKTLRPYIRGLLGNLIPNVIPIRVIEGIGWFGQFALMYTEGMAANHGGTIKIGNAGIDPNRH